MPATDDAQHIKRVAIELIEAYVNTDRERVRELSGGLGGAVGEEVISELKVFAAFLTRRVQETGVAWKPSDSREAVARAVANLVEPEVEFAVISAWEAYSVGEHEAAETVAQGDPLVFVHMLAAFSAAIGKAVYDPLELLATLRIAAGLAE
ncbi:hypothetical protein [Actinorugispora endophytica]|uniref:Uncharacterized protein n=1 Tax=Actinorugispora endophytica TaxID=1605990 RepID=A0A4R6URH2_9ACTN|nr:hypothetical protein [Actinorugispora endophytica]TDQ48193.1 hypothetical protein EV190_1197 [Actinorugispora endophytica]